MDSSFIDAFVEQVFASGLGLFVHDKSSPNTGRIRDLLQKPVTFYVSDDTPEIFIRCQHITRFVKHGEPHPVGVRT